MTRAFTTSGLLATAACLFLSACATAPGTSPATSHVTPPATAAATASTPATASARASLAPTGVLRVAVYPGSPTSLVEAAPEDRMRGVTVDLGRALAARIGVPARIVVYPRVAEVVAALQRGEADFTVTNATTERARLIAFAEPLVDLELGAMALTSSSKVTAADRMDQPGVVIGVSQGSSSERALGALFKQAKLRTFPTLDAARAALQAKEIDAFATNKGILFEQAERLPGAKVLDGRWGAEHLAPAIPQGRAAGLAYLQAFTRDVRSGGELERASQRAGLRGTIAPQP